MKKKVGLAWRADIEKNSFKNFIIAVEEAGGEPVLLGQVVDYDLEYTGGDLIKTGIDDNDYLSDEYAVVVKENTYHNSNVEEVMNNIEAVIFTGGEDISPTLTRQVEEWHGISYEKNYNAERDVSDYLLMSYCIDKDIPVMGFCRGMQMLAVVSGASVIQDIPVFYEELGLPYGFEHRNNKSVPEAYRDYASHDVDIIDKDSFIYDIFRCRKVRKLPSWHHQAVRSINGTPLKVTATSEVSGYEMIEAIERTDKTLIAGFQAHPEAAVAKHARKDANADKYMEKETALKIFTYLLEKMS